ncbi:MAG: MFS transporter [Candidatus Cryptobacteroides sp.]|nr:MFS transporter [Bacteroidales bacterium]MDY5494521.1 MFS transporter [Candidatus Cryptobacteroides sp.]
MSLYKYFRISKPAPDRVPGDRVDAEYRRLRSRTFWGASVVYSLYYVCRMTLSVVKQPLIDGGVLSASDLGLIGSALLLVYAFGKFVNGFIADYCNIRRFMAAGLFISAAVNLVMGLLGFLGRAVSIPGIVMMAVFFILWGANGWVQSMGAPPGIINLSRWFPLSKRGTYYSIFSSTPYIGKFLTFILTGVIVGALGWEWGFIFAAAAGFAGTAISLVFISDTPESKGLPSIQELSGEKPVKTDSMPTRELQKIVLRHPGIWIIALSSAFVYITQYAISGWGVLFLQKAKDFSLQGATQIIAFSEAFGVAGTIFAGWLSDTVFRGDRVKPVLISGIFCCASLLLFLFTGGGYLMNILYVSVFSLFIGVLYCIVAGLMAVDIVPRKATGAALGIVGISSYVAAAIQDVVTGYLIEGGADKAYDFTSAAIFWTAACVLSFVLPVLNWRSMMKKVVEA